MRQSAIFSSEASFVYVCALRISVHKSFIGGRRLSYCFLKLWIWIIIIYCSRGGLQMLSIWHSMFFFFIFCSPAFPRTYTPSSVYFTNSSPPPDSQMWSTSSNANSDEYLEPKQTLPTFQRLTSNSYYGPNGRAAHSGYGAQLVGLCESNNQNLSSKWLILLLVFAFRTIPG